MYKKHRFSAPLTVALGVFAALVLPTAAHANHIDGDATATCAYVGGVPTATVTVKYIEFLASDGPVTGNIRIGDTSHPVGPLVWVGTGEQTFTIAVTPGTFSVSGSFAWPKKQRDFNGDFNAADMTCPPPPEPPVTPSGTPPSGGALPETTLSGIARLRGESGCVEQTFRARVTGRSIASVAFFLDGRLVKRFRGERARYSVKVRPARLGFGRHKVIARVRFTAESGTSARALRMMFRRCAQGAVAPRFTG